MRCYAQDRREVRSELAFLTTMVTRVSLDHLKSARVKREQYPGPWLPEPLGDDASMALLDTDATVQPSAERDLERLQSVSLAFLALLEALTPLERATFLLHEVFDYSHGEVGRMLDRSEAACRQSYRPPRQVLHARPRGTASPQRHRELLEAFLRACEHGDLPALMRLLADDVVARSDGGGVVTAARKPLHGARAVARLYRGVWQQRGPQDTAVLGWANGWPALIARRGDVLRAVIQVHADGERIDEVVAVLNPAKLAPLARALGLRVLDAKVA